VPTGHNDEPELLQLLGDVLDIADGREVTWALDMTAANPVLIAVLINHPGHQVAPARAGCSEGVPGVSKIPGDPDTHGRVYVGADGRGLQYGNPS
jgi:hypothetical protein